MQNDRNCGTVKYKSCVCERNLWEAKSGFIHNVNELVLKIKKCECDF